MNYEALFSLFWGLFQLFSGFCCLFVAWLFHGMIRRERRIDREVQELYTYAAAHCSTDYLMGIKDVAELLNIALGSPCET